MRDYIFYPLALTKPMMDLGKKAGQKYGKHIGRVLPACIANIVVFIVVGVWHGPQFHFLVWGLYNGIVIALGDLLEPCFSGLSKRCKIPVESKGFHVFRIIRTFVVVNIGWYFDRIEDVSTAFVGLWRSLSSFQADQFVFAVRNTLFNSATVKPIYMAGSFCIAAVSILLIFVISQRAGKRPRGGAGEIHTDPCGCRNCHAVSDLVVFYVCTKCGRISLCKLLTIRKLPVA